MVVTLDSHEVADTKRFTRELLEQGQELLLRHRVSSSSAVSRDLFGTGLQLAEHRQLINVGDQDCAAQRRSFEAEIGEVLEAINRLQAIYDEAWFQRRGPAA
jgi:glycerol-3-phosphate O-acyltransferase